MLLTRDSQEVIILSIVAITGHWTSQTRLIWSVSSCQSWADVKLSWREIVRRSDIDLLLSWRASCKVSSQVEMTGFCPTLGKTWSQLETVPINCHLACQWHAWMVMAHCLFFCVLHSMFIRCINTKYFEIFKIATILDMARPEIILFNSPTWKTQTWNGLDEL